MNPNPHGEVSTHKLKNAGHVRTINSESIRVLQVDGSDNILLATGTTTPTSTQNGEAGYAKGAMYIETDVGSGSSGTYINIGTASSASWFQFASNDGRTKTVGMNIGGFNATEQKFLFAVPFGCSILDVVLVSDTATTGSDGSNNYQFQVANLTQTQDLLSSQVSTNGNEIAADTVFTITPDQNTGVAPDDVLELQITKNGTATDLSGAEVIVEVHYVVN